jgi:hypothetical protein
MLIAQGTAAYWYTEQATVTFHNPHIAWAINGGRYQFETKRKRKKIPSSYVKFAYKEMQASTVSMMEEWLIRYLE